MIQSKITIGDWVSIENDMLESTITFEGIPILRGQLLNNNGIFNPLLKTYNSKYLLEKLDPGDIEKSKSTIINTAIEFIEKHKDLII